MDNEAIVALLPQREQLSVELEQLEATLAELNTRREELSEQLAILSGVSELHRGVALVISGEGENTEFRPAASSISRRARVYRNRQTGSFGLYTYDDLGRERWRGSSFSRQAAQVMARDWVASGEFELVL